MLNKDKPLWLPSGSVRSIIALAIVGAYLVGAVDREVVMLVLGAYFLDRASNGIN